jgi:transposase
LNKVEQRASIVIWKYRQGFQKDLMDLDVRLFVGEPDAWILHHDNALAHDALTLREFLAKKSIFKLDHPPYSPDLAPCDFWLFRKLKTALKGHIFSDIADIQGHATTILQSIPEEEFQKCFEQWKHRLTKCMMRKETTSKVTATISV